MSDHIETAKRLRRMQGWYWRECMLARWPDGTSQRISQDDVKVYGGYPDLADHATAGVLLGMLAEHGSVTLSQEWYDGPLWMVWVHTQDCWSSGDPPDVETGALDHWGHAIALALLEVHGE